MTYFTKFPQIYYDFKLGASNDTTLLVIKDITQNVRLKKDILSNITLYDYYHMQEGETPEIVAEKVYGNPLYHWVIMLTNERFDYIDDFPLTSASLENYITQKYGDAKYDIHHYTADGYTVNEDYEGAQAVTNYDYEYTQNDAKAKIKLIKPSLLQQVLKEYEEAFNSTGFKPRVG